MILEISAALAVLIFAILALVIVKALMRLQKTLDRVDCLLFDLELKSKNLDPLFRSLSNLGEICDTETDLLKRASLERRKKQECQDLSASTEWVDWLALSMKLGAKLIKRR